MPKQRETHRADVLAPPASADGDIPPFGLELRSIAFRSGDSSTPDSPTLAVYAEVTIRGAQGPAPIECRLQFEVPGYPPIGLPNMAGWLASTLRQAICGHPPAG